MKKTILNEWTFIITLLTFIFVCFLSTGFKDETFGDVVINFFGSIMLIALVVSISFVDVPKKLQRLVLVFTLVMLIISMSSCRSVRSGYGCPDTRNMIGYR